MHRFVVFWSSLANYSIIKDIRRKCRRTGSCKLPATVSDQVHVDLQLRRHVLSTSITPVDLRRRYVCGAGLAGACRRFNCLLWYLKNAIISFSCSCKMVIITFPDFSLTFSILPDFSQTTIQFPDFSMFSRWVVTLSLTKTNIYKNCKSIRKNVTD